MKRECSIWKTDWNCNITQIAQENVGYPVLHWIEMQLSNGQPFQLEISSKRLCLVRAAQ